MVKRTPPKDHKLKVIVVGAVDDIDGMSLTALISYFQGIDTQGLIDPLFHMDEPEYDYGYYRYILVSGFEKKSDKELEHDRMVAKRRREAAEKRRISIANKEKEQLRKLASKYPEEISNTFTLL